MLLFHLHDLAGKEDDKKEDTFGEKLASQIIKNLQIEINNVHIRYEDSYSIPGRVFSLGVTLHFLVFKTYIPDDHVIATRDESAMEFFKVSLDLLLLSNQRVNLASLGIYWNHDSALFSGKPRGPLWPISSSATLHIHARPEKTDYTVPRFSIDVDFSEIQLNLALCQYRDITSFLDATDRLMVQSKYRKYRPDISLNNHAKAWWNYAITAILEEHIRRKSRMWSWVHIKEHRRIAKEYITLYKKRLGSDKLTREQQLLLGDYEDALDVFNIVVCRQQAQVQAKKDAAAPKPKGGGIFSWFTRSSTSSDPGSSSEDSSTSQGSAILRRIKSEMTSEEKARLFAAIDYSEASGGGGYPATYVSATASITLRQLGFSLLDEKLKDPHIISFVISKLTIGVEQREGDQALSVKVRLDDLESIGARPSSGQTGVARSDPPVLITSRVAELRRQELLTDADKAISEQQQQLLVFDFAKNPLNRKADQCLFFYADPLQIVYDADTINKIVHFLTPPEELRFNELSTQMLSSLEDVKEITASGLRHMANRRLYTDVQIIIQPSCFILPDTGVYRNGCRLLLVDCGSLTIRSTETRAQEGTGVLDTVAKSNGGKSRSRMIRNATFDELKDDAYDCYEITLSSMQIIMAEEGDDWRALRTKHQSPNHILRPLGINLSAKRCLLQNDINFPKILISGCLPVFSLALMDKVLKSLTELIDNVPFPESNKRLRTPENPDELLKNMVFVSSDDFVTTRDLVRASRFNRSASQSTVGSWISESVNDPEDEQEEGRINLATEQPEAEFSDSNLKPMDPSVADSGTDGDDAHTQANKTTHNASRDAAAQRRRLANLIDLELDFVIRMIEIQVLQHSDQPSPTDAQLAVLCLTVHEVGAKATKRRWDQELQARIGTLSLSVPRYIDQRSGKAVCLMKTKRHIEGHHLLSVHLLVAEKGAPDFEKRYNNTRHRLRCEFKALELCIHKEATVQLFKFFNNLVDDLVVSPMGQKPDPVTVAVDKIGEKQGLDAASDVALSPDMPQHMTAVEALDFRLARKNERRLIRLDAAAAASKSGRTMVVREVVITQWSIDATLDKVTLLLCSDEVDLASATIHSLRLNMFTCYQTTELSAILSEISIVDNVESTDYRKIMWIDPAESVISMQLTHFTRGSQLPGNSCDPDKLDLALSLQFGKIRVIFLHYFVLRISEFMSAFSIQTRAVLNQVNELSDAAMQQVQEVAMKSSTFRLGLHVVAQAPVIYIPQHSFSNKALMADFGCITYKNRFEFVKNADGIPDVCGPIPEPGLMFEHADVTLENLRLSRAVLMESAVTSEKPVIHPINIELHLRRNLSPESCATVPLLWLDSSVKSIHVSLTQGDYRAIQEVVLDNLAEVPPSTISAKSASHLAPSPALQSHAFATASPNVSKVHGSAVTKSKSDLPIVSSVLPLMIAVQFSFEMESATLDLLSSGVAEDELQHVSAEPHLALCSLRRFGVSGHVSTDSSCKVNVQLFDIQLTDTRPDAEKKITKVLDRADLPDESEVLLHVEFLQDSSKHQKVHVKLRSLHFCASMDYLMALADFHLKSYPKFEKRVTVLNPITESGKRKRKEHPVSSKRKHRRTAMPPTEYPYDLELRVEVGCPEVVLVEDIYSLDTNSLKLTATFEMQYTMKKDVVIMDATLKGLTIVACPYIEPFRGAFSKEILCPTQLSFYSKQPISSGMQGSLHVDTLLTNINPGTIQLIAHILSSVQSGLQSLEPLKGAKKTTRSNSRDTKRVRYPEERNDDSGVNFWDPVPLDELDLPYLSPCNTLPVDYSDQESISIGCDVSKVLEHLEDRSPDKMDRNIIVIRLRTIRVVLESQVGTRSMPMLVLESSVDGEFLSPESDLQVKLTVDLSLSYYNDALSQWEQLLETLPDEDGRMWSLQIEVSTANLDDLVAEEDLDEVGCLQASANTILVVSRDNLELTLTKSALDMLSNLGRSFEAAYNQKFSEFEYELGGELAAPYRIQNRTGWPMALRTDPLLLRVLGDSRRSSIALLRKSFTHSIRRDRGPASSIISGTQNSQALEPSAIGIPTPWEVDQGIHILADGEEMGFIEPERMSRKVLTVRSVTEKTHRHMVWTAWCPSTGTKPSTKYETGLPLHSVGSIMLLLPKHISNSPGDASHSKDIYFPVVAQTTTYLGTRVINLRSTVQIVNDTSDVLCLFVHNTSASTDRRINRLAVLEAGEIYAVPVGVINSRESTGIFIGPDVGVTTLSTTAAYWPESACLSSQTGYGRSQDLVYLAPVTEKSASRSSLHTLQPISATLSRPTETTRPLLKWPVQFMQCKSKTSDLTYYYSITTLNMSTSPETHCATLTARTGSLAGSSSSDLYANDFQLVIRNSVILHNQLPVAINYIVSDRVGEISPGNQCTMRTVSPLDSTLDVSFDYDGHLYRGTLSITSNMDELTVCTFESRLGYELLTLHLGVRNASDFGQVALTLYAPYWMINKTGKDLTYKSSDETEINHPASFSGALLFSSLAKSVFGKRKVPSSAENPSRAKLMLKSLGCGFNTPASVTDESKLQKPRKRKQFGFTRAPTLQKKHKVFTTDFHWLALLCGLVFLL
ncbi:unnamed protein product [Dicrocoelium dendriticum]|nr:unnamed protein product [Dicrocoelium dendriticum]